MSLLVRLIDRFLTKPIAVEEEKHVFKFCERNPEAKLLDCGCSDGEYTLKVAAEIGTENISGMDVVAEKLEVAKARGMSVFQSDLDDKLPFDDQSLDVILLLQVIEHLCHTDSFLRELHRVLAPEGYVIVQTPNLSAFYSILYLMAGKQPVQATVSDEILAGSWNPRGKLREPDEGPQHRRVFTAAALRELFDYHGFKVEKTYGIGFYPFPFPLAKVLAFFDRRHATTILMKARKKR